VSVVWDPARYGVFSSERSQPFFDLVSRIPADDPRGVVDLGCGSGELTATLAHRWPDARVHGVDSSPQMIGRARAGSESDRVDFELADLAGWRPSDETDVVVSNAALQWVPEHRVLLRGWADDLKPGATLAWQVPGNFESPSHRAMRELAESKHWRGRLAGVLRHADAVDSPAGYLDLLVGAGFEASVWETTYLHVLHGPDPVLEWVRGTGLRPILQALPPAEAAEFERVYAETLRAAYPSGEHGTVYPFRRIFAVGRKR
jgi:trans-aconitate 2-methyltransferase